MVMTLREDILFFVYHPGKTISGRWSNLRHNSPSQRRTKAFDCFKRRSTRTRIEWLINYGDAKVIKQIERSALIKGDDLQPLHKRNNHRQSSNMKKARWAKKRVFVSIQMLLMHEIPRIALKIHGAINWKTKRAPWRDNRTIVKNNRVAVPTVKTSFY